METEVTEPWRGWSGTAVGHREQPQRMSPHIPALSPGNVATSTSCPPISSTIHNADNTHLVTPTAFLKGPDLVISRNRPHLGAPNAFAFTAKYLPAPCAL